VRLELIMTQHIRRSQFIFTYGPGAILEGPKGPRVIPAPDIGLFSTGSLPPDRYAVSDQRLSQGLLSGARIFRLPSNAELQRPENQYIYRTKPFPNWKLCLNILQHNGNFYVLYQGSSCPLCGGTGWRGREAIRFIKACPAGHVDEVEWYTLAHGNSRTCQHNSWFRWFGGGGALANIEIECPVCGNRKISLGVAYKIDWNCSGRFPEREPPGSLPNRPGCERRAKIIQRQASNLRVPELLTLFSIPPRYTRLSSLLQIRPILDSIIANRPTSKQQLEHYLRRLAQANRISQGDANEILSCSWNEINEAIEAVLTPVQTSYRSLILEEFHEFIKGSLQGIPPIRGNRPESPVLIEINPNLVQRFAGPKGTRFRVTPVLRLRTVTVQHAYRREVDTRFISTPVDVSFPDPLDPQQKWYPGVEFLGEGIFMILDSDEGWISGLSGTAANRWLKSFRNPSPYLHVPHVFRDPSSRDELHPVFVWWHTLSHLLIRVIAAEAGYSSASIRERIYFENDGMRIRGGILLYATQPGTEGTLGGLLALAPHMRNMLQVTFQEAEVCSGDPLCREHQFRDGGYNGAACYSCLLLSETSCEHRNMWLDRNVLLENLP
jgi:hypothetical protein